jgi:phosphoglycolate phosphatase-like HAD superfamily hydrolase
MRADTVSTISLGDSARDIVASRRAGVRSAAALWGFGGEDKLKAAMPDYAFKTPSEALLLFT